jgi:DhnA family fructose-bisphosphate aldolase class Ia
LVRGGGKAEDLVILHRTEQLIDQGVAGIVYGRNVIQHANPAGMTKALKAIVHEGSTAEEARRFLSAKGGQS